MRKTVLFIRFALCIAIGLVGSSLFATARAISVPNPFVRVQGIFVQKLPKQHALASVALAASEEPFLSNTTISASISSQKIVEPQIQVANTEESEPGEIPAVTLVPEKSIISAAVGVSVVTDEDLSPPPIPTKPPVSPTPVLSSSPVNPSPSNQSTSGLNADMLFGMINATRTQSGLPAFEKNDLTCSMASSRAPEIQNEIFGTSYMHAGFYARHVAGANENIISINSEQAAYNWWMNSPVHRSAILGSYKYSCIACSGTSCSEIFSN